MQSWPLLLLLLVPFAAAQTVTVDSNYSGYSPAVLTDGVIDAFGGSATTWSSASSGADNWVEFAWEGPVSISNLTLHWAFLDFLGTYTTSQEVRVQYWDGSQYVTAHTYNGPGNLSNTTLAFWPATAARWRLYQPGGMGPLGYTTTFRLTEIEWGVGSCGPRGDRNGDCRVDASDLLLVVAWFGRQAFDLRADSNDDGVVDLYDLVRVARDWGGSDQTPPVRSAGSPTGALPAGAGTATISLSTDEPATCRFSTTAATPYASMNTMSTTGSTTHSHSLAVQDGQSYTRYVRCQDASGNANPDDYAISFSVAAPSGPPPSGAFFSDDFESYAVGGIDHQGFLDPSGFSWGGARYATISNALARSGANSLRIEYGPFEPDGSSHMWGEQRFDLGRDATELWIEHYTYFPDGTEGVGSRYIHEDPSTSSWNIKFVSMWADTYYGEPIALFQLWPLRDADQGSSVNVGITYGNQDGDADLVRYPSASNGGTYVSVGDRGRWIQSRIHLRVADLDQANGELQMWVDGVNIINVTGVAWFDEGRLNNYLRNGYFFGYDNQHFSQNTSLFIDDVAFYDTDPGWWSSAVCGDGACTMNEGCATCPQDCGTCQSTTSDIIFLHHSTGSVVLQGGFGADLASYNSAQGTDYRLTDREYPKASPYGWNNYPYDYWNIWVNHAGPAQYLTEDTLELLTQDYDVIMFKHCYPASDILADTGSPDITSSSHRIENYQLQYAALKDKLHEFPDKKFILWTGAALVQNGRDEAIGQRSRDFFTWVKSDWDEPGDNIFIWDFYELETGGGNWLLLENARSSSDSHPNTAFTTSISDFLAQRIVDVIEGRGDTGSITGS